MIKGQPFPPGFDEWCELVEPPSNTKRRFQEHKSFSKTETEMKDEPGGIDAVAQSFVRSVTETDSYTSWSRIDLDPSGNYANHGLTFKFPEQSSASTITSENTHIWTLFIGGQFNAILCENLRTHSCQLRVQKDKCSVRLVNCVIGKLSIAFIDKHHVSKPNLELHNCWIGTLIIGPKTVWRLSVTGGGIAQIECPSSDGENPFTGAVSFKKVFFPSSPRQTTLFQNPHAYRSLYAHLKKLDNTLMANQMRSHQLRAERADEGYRFAQFTNWIYDIFSNYGMSPARPILWLLGLFLLTVTYLYNCDYGTLTQPEDFYKGANEVLLDKNGGRFYRSLLLPLQSIINPFGIFFDARKLIVPTTLLSTVLLTIQGLLSDMLLVMTALSIRRRYKAE